MAAASASQLTVAFAVRPGAGVLTAVVTSNGVSSGAPVQVAVVGAPDLTLTLADDVGHAALSN